MAAWWCGGFAGLAIIVYLLLDPTPPVNSLQFHSDKLLHFLAFGGLTGWFAGLLERRAWPFLAIGMLGFGLATELIQSAMRMGRLAELGDFAADAAGVLIALLLARVGFEHWALFFERWFRQKG